MIEHVETQRDATTGQFLPGNKSGRGNPFAKQVAALRTAMLNAVTEEDMRQIILKLIEKAKAGDVASAREVLERTLGKPVEVDLFERLEGLEATYEALQKRSNGR
jgi:hypothetical protein